MLKLICMKSKTIKHMAIFSTLGIVFIIGQIFYYANLSSKFLKSAGENRPNLQANLINIVFLKLILVTPSRELNVSQKDMENWVQAYDRSYTGKNELRLNHDAIVMYLAKIAKHFSITSINARLTISTSGQTSEFRTSKNGQSLNIPSSTLEISSAIFKHKSSESTTIKINLVLDEIIPDITLDKVNRLGIKELLATGESDFTGSPKFRTKNIHAGSDKFSGIIVKPGDEFSFNETLGEVTASTGFVPELVIKNGTLIPEYGGGICQVSTTLFRAGAKAGLPILERHAHSLPVRYYNPQGYDATIYPGVSDFRFKNDTQSHILIQPKIVGSKIYFEIYGTKDGRKTVIDGPHQYDIQANGSMKAWLGRTVTYTDGHEIKDTFNSSYKSPSLFPTVR